MLRNIIGRIFNAFFVFFSFIFWKNLILPAERRRFLKKNRNQKKRKYWTDFQLKKGQFLDGFSTLQHIYIYIHIHIHIHIHIYMWDLHAYVAILGFFRVKQRKQLVLQCSEAASNVWDDISQPTECLFLQYSQLAPASILGDRAFHICKLHFTLRFLWFFRKPKLPHCTQRTPKGGAKQRGGTKTDEENPHGKQFPTPPLTSVRPPPPSVISLIKSLTNTQNFPQVTPSKWRPILARFPPPPPPLFCPPPFGSAQWYTEGTTHAIRLVTNKKAPIDCLRHMAEAPTFPTKRLL